MKGKKGPLGYIFIQLFLDKGRSVFGFEYIQNFSSIFYTIFYCILSSEILDNRIRTTTFRRSIAWRQANIPYSPPRRSISWVPSVSKFWSAHVVNQKVGWRIKTYHQVWNSHDSLNDLKDEWKRENSYLAHFHQKVLIIRIKKLTTKYCESRWHTWSTTILAKCICSYRNWFTFSASLRIFSMTSKDFVEIRNDF